MDKPKKPLWAGEYEKAKSAIVNLENQIEKLKKELEDKTKAFDLKFKYLESEYEKYEQDLRQWERTAVFQGRKYIEDGGFLRSEENLDYMLTHYHWDAKKKFLEANIEFDAYHEGLEKGVSVERIEDVTEPLVTNVSKDLFPDSQTNRFYKIAHMSDGNIVGFQLIDKYPNIPWRLYVFKKK